MLRYLIKVASNRGLLAHSKTLTTWLSPSLSSSGRATTFASGPFSASNIERTLKELNEESLRKKLVGDYEADGTARQSSVLIPLCRHEGKPSILFTLRSNRLSRHKGYPCFPGGVFEDGDVDSIHTALRETHEELGLESKYVKVLGTMPRFKVPRDNIEITAVIADIGDIDSHELKINHNEVPTKSGASQPCYYIFSLHAWCPTSISDPFVQSFLGKNTNRRTLPARATKEIFFAVIK
ncbi:uncharacterized Nudix hydrolase NudL-like isoform X2 [Varroa destructor]|uniref:Nudix hydrolase domain-containing protein n=1 Tax=Varroa destructor TaxID=109461 RepID=A0A7M7KWJ1_VARDE|nr:uncharacterized Nudix hydrolase NudL-like isoform X2 [Varroa destructor]